MCQPDYFSCAKENVVNLAANDPEFSQAWAGALAKAEASLSDSTEQHLLNIIDTIDESICARS